MSQNELNTRVKNKYDTQANWNANNIKLQKGEIGFVTTPDGRILAKVGNGTSDYNNLPFITEPYSMKIINTTSTTTILVGQYNNIFFCNNDSDITLTLPSVTLAGNGWKCFVEIKETSKNVIVTSSSSPMIMYGTTVTNNAITLGAPNYVQFICDGTNWHVVPHVLQKLV